MEQLGEGGMGVVYLGHHEALGHRVAVKVLQLELSRHADMVQRFFNEARAATSIRNLGIVQIFDFGTAPDGRAYFVMELLEGQNLAARLKQRRLDYTECCRIGRQVANVMQAAHAAGITHRDLKPDNLFLIPDAEVVGGERVKVLDFGIAKLADEVHTSGMRTRTGLMMGTPQYMSPEQSRGAGVVDSRSDIYSLGCILFEMACGRRPFVEEGVGEILGAHQYLDPPQPRRFAPDIPGELAKLILQMLAKQPESRPQPMAVIGQVLEEILRTLDGPPKRVPTPLPVLQDSAISVISTTLGDSAGMASVGPRTGTRRRRLSFMLGGIVVGVVALAIAVGAYSSRSSGPSAAGAATGVADADTDAGLAERSPSMGPSLTPDAAIDNERAALATSVESRIKSFEAAMQDGNLQRAKTELDAIPLTVSDYGALKQKYDQAEAAAIAEMVQQLKNAARDDCKEYNRIIEQEKSSRPPHVAAEAQRQVRCIAVTKAQPFSPCDPDAFSQIAREQYSAGKLTAAIESYEAAWNCKQDPKYANKAFSVACHIPSVRKAKLFWMRMPPAMRQSELGIMVCVRNGITENMLNAR
ncbi:MAG TPA: serine/threonine-protein kinase [Kofleriaceae bacterium]|nr:serine/threonine-protein kinase [Kofleriaceae bacterium]